MASTADSTPGTPRFPPPPMPIDDEHAQAFDALADLFLGSSSLEAPAASSLDDTPLTTPTVEEPIDQPAAPSTPTATLRLKRDDDHHDDQPAHSDPDESTHHQPDPLPEVETSRTPQIEVILQAPLPGLASSWVQHHARAQASSHGQLTLIRAGRSSCRVDRLHVRAGGYAPAPGTLHTDLRQALHAARSISSRTVIAPSEGDEHALLLSSSCTHITLICGCDQSSVVGAYRRLKRLAELFTTTNNNPSSTPSTPEIRILFVGSDEHTAKAAFARLSEAAGSFLRMPLAMLTPVHRLSPAGNVLADTLYDGPLTLELAEALPILSAVTPPPARTPEPAPAPRRCDAPPISPRTRRLLTDEELAGLIEFIPSTSSTSSTLRDDTTPILDAAVESIHAEFDLDFDIEDTADLDQPSAQPVVDRANEPAAAASSSAPSPAPATNLASLIAGLSPLLARCPFTPTVQLALDAQGQLHLLSNEPLPQAVSDLEVASAWATAHRELLALTPGCQALTTSSTAATPPLRHWFTPDAKAAKHMLDANLRVHLLLTITTPGLHACAIN